MIAWGRAIAICSVALLFAVPSTRTHAQGASAFEAAKKLADSGKHSDAIGALSRTLSSGTLDPANTARGFFLRGVSYVKSGKNPQAISDLTNALWLTGLSPTERTTAYQMRAAAYKASGFKAKAAADLKKASAKVAAPTQTAAVVPPPSTKVVAKTPATNAWATQTANTAVKPVTTAVKATPLPKPAAAPGTGSTVSTFFSGLFNGAGSSQTASTATAALTRESGGPAPEVVTKTVKRRVPQTTKPAQTAAVAAVSGDTALSSWSSDVAAAPIKKTVKAKPVAPKQVAAVNWNTAVAASTASKPSVPKKAKTVKSKPKRVRKGRFNVQVATVRDRATAEQIRARVSKQAPKALAGLKPSIDAAVLGNMGTFFRVRVNGLQTRQASARLCSTLQKQGHDCFLLTR